MNARLIVWLRLRTKCVLTEFSHGSCCLYMYTGSVCVVCVYVHWQCVVCVCGVYVHWQCVVCVCVCMYTGSVWCVCVCVCVHRQCVVCALTPTSLWGNSCVQDGVMGCAYLVG